MEILTKQRYRIIAVIHIYVYIIYCILSKPVYSGLLPHPKGAQATCAL